MKLVFTTVDKAGQLHQWSCAVDQEEVAFELLSLIASKGEDTILEACLLERKTRTTLPVAAFDGECFSGAFRKLKKQWRKLLEEPAPLVKIDYRELVRLTLQRVEQCERNIIRIKHTIETIRALMQRTHDSGFGGTTTVSIIRHYQRIIHQCEYRLGQLQCHHQGAIRRLNQLMSS